MNFIMEFSVQEDYKDLYTLYKAWILNHNEC